MSDLAEDRASDDGFGPFLDLVPKGALPSCGFRVVSYVTPTGGIGFRFDQAGDTAITNLIGMIEMCKHDITRIASGYTRTVSRNEEDDD